MKVLVTGSAGHLGEALVRTLQTMQIPVTGADILPSLFTTYVGSISDRDFVQQCMQGATAILHTATLHKPHVGTHSRQDFVDVNITGTLNLLEEAVAANVDAFIFTSTTSTFGDALIPPAGEPAAWITEEVPPIPKNIYGATKTAAEDLCQLFARNQQLPCLILRTSRFFPEADDNKHMRDTFDSDNLKANEYMYRRVDIEDAVSAHLLAMKRAKDIGFSKYIISGTTPFTQDDLAALRKDAASVIRNYYPDVDAIYNKAGWKLPAALDRVYVNTKAIKELGWQPTHDFRSILDKLKAGQDIKSEMAKIIGIKGYHQETVSE